MLVVAALWLVLPGDGASAQGRQVTIAAFASKHVAPRKIIVWLPDAYDREPGRRFPVLYLQDGDDAFGVDRLDVDGAITRLSARGEMRPTIVVAIASTGLRQREYFPGKFYDLLPPDYRKSVDLVTRGAPMGDAYLAFVATEVKPFVDGEYRTLATPADTSILGTSMGGLIAIYAVGEYPQVFGQGAGLSPYWPLGNPVGPPIGTPDGATMIANVFGTWLMNSKADPKRNSLYMDRGTAGLDSAFEPITNMIELVMPGWRRGVSRETRIFPGAGHDLKAWRERIEIPLAFLDRD
jgi:enterochelin esterase-like enzyme